MLNEEQLKKIAKLFEEKIFPVMKDNPKAFEELGNKAREARDFLEKKESNKEQK